MSALADRCCTVGCQCDATEKVEITAHGSTFVDRVCARCAHFYVTYSGVLVGMDAFTARRVDV